MITTAKIVSHRSGRPAAVGKITTPNFSFFVVEEERDNSAERQRCRRLLQYACEQCLTPHEQQVIAGHYREGKNLTEISRETGISVSTLSHRLCSARKKLLRFAEQASIIHQIYVDRQGDHVS